MTTAVLYLDDAGTIQAHHKPLRGGQSPLFVLAGVTLRLTDWRAVDRDYLRLKTHRFAPQIKRSSARPEQWEPKDICAPRNAHDNRRQAFIREILDLLGRYDSKCFAITFLKDHRNPTSPPTLYSMALQHISERFNAYVAEHPDLENGIIIVDQSNYQLDVQVGMSYLSYVFGHTSGRQLTCLQEGPLFAHSLLTAGVQIAHIMANLVAGANYHRICKTFPGALDYSHIQQYWPDLSSLEFKSRTEHNGRRMFGYRVHDYRDDQDK